MEHRCLLSPLADVVRAALVVDSADQADRVDRVAIAVPGDGGGAAAAEADGGQVDRAAAEVKAAGTGKALDQAGQQLR
jgi:hypothetical protein